MDYSIPNCSITRAQIAKIISKYQSQSYKRPKNQLATAKELLALCPTNIIWDWGCGTGLSTINLAESYPQHTIIGVDQSAHRLAKNPVIQGNYHIQSKKNIIFVRANIIDLILNWQGPQAKQQFWLHPNPWPLSKHVKRRWPMHPIFAAAMNMAETTTMRCNWLSYAQQWHWANTYLGYNSKLEIYQDKAITAFEIKYQKSQQTIYQVIC